MKYVLILSIATLLSACGLPGYQKSEEAIVLKIDTATLLKGRNIKANVTVCNSDSAEHIPH